MVAERSNFALSRRAFCTLGAGALAATVCSRSVFGHMEAPAARLPRFKLNYLLASPLYGTASLATVAREAKKTGSDSIDVWGRPHANHREQIADRGPEAVERMLEKYGVRLAAITRYDLGPYRLQEEMPVLNRFGGTLLVSGAIPHSGNSMKHDVRQFVSSMAAHVEQAAKFGITIGIENHSNTILDTPDAVRYFVQLIDSPNLGLAMAPYHLPQEPELIAGLIEQAGDRLVLFQAWQHGLGCTRKLPKEEELMQLPGRGPLDFTPIMAALKKINFRGPTEIFMHPVPRGIPILKPASAVTAEINRARDYLESCLMNAA